MWSETLLLLWEFVLLLAPIFELTKAPPESFPATYDCCLTHPTPAHTPSGESFSFAGYRFM